MAASWKQDALVIGKATVLSPASVYIDDKVSGSSEHWLEQQVPDLRTMFGVS